MQSELLFAYCCLISVGCYTNTFNIGILLEEGSQEYIQEAVDIIEKAVNERIFTLFRDCSFHPIFTFVSSNNFEQLRQKVCELSDAGAVVLLGPSNREFAMLIEPLCRELGIAYIKYHWDPVYSKAEETNSSYVINLFPTSQYSILLDRLLSHWKWDYFTFVYTNKEAPRQLSPVLSRTVVTPSLLMVDDSTEQGLMIAALALRGICDRRFCWVKRNRVIIDMSPNNTLRFLDAALKLGMISIHNWFVVSSLDDLDNHLEQYVHNTMRLSLITIWKGDIDPLIHDRDKIKELYNSWLRKIGHSRITPFKDFAYIFDAILTSCHLNHPLPKARSCRSSSTSNNSKSLHVRTVRGLTGLLSFNDNGDRLDNQLQIWEFGMDGTALNTGTWSSDRTGAKQLTMRAASIPGTQEYDINRRHQARVLRVSTIAERPYIMEKVLPNGKAAPFSL
ncbi:unnamed protein product [Cylicocyclus nassatus]|uniref:Receptor ligand binding region domain-containing protein n=1 Tax=Cylicocyclus nassatus TaxID=53992 RepID=A0AA36HH29_CYLNA|nr:unnamed protein product [Cylicocyclus nassatus]